MWEQINEHSVAFDVVVRVFCVNGMLRVNCVVCLCCIEEARCVRPNATSPNVTAFVQGPNGQYFVPGECLMSENE